MKSFSGRFVGYRIKKVAETERILDIGLLTKRRNQDLEYKSQVIERNFKDLMSRSDKQNQLNILNGGTGPSYKSDPVYIRLTQISDYIELNLKDKIKRKSKESYVLNVAKYFFNQLQEEIKGRRIDKEEYSDLLNFSDFENLDYGLCYARTRFNDAIESQDRFFPDYNAAKEKCCLNIKARYIESYAFRQRCKKDEQEKRQ